MCLNLIVELGPKDRTRISEIVEFRQLDGVFVESFAPRKYWFRRGADPAVIFLTDHEAGSSCACNFLAETADWNSETWDMNPELLHGLARCLTKISANCLEPITFEAVWAGDQLTDVAVSITDLVEVINQGRLGVKTRYIVAAE